MERLQTVVFPNSELRDHPDLFYRRVEAVERTGTGEFKKVVRLFFDSYMNALAVKKWRQYADLGPLHFCVRLAGRTRVVIHAARLYSYARTEAKPLATHEIVSDGRGYVEIELPPAPDATMIFVEIDYDDGEVFELHDAYFGTRTPPPNDVKIAVVTCTYRREGYVWKNRERFLAFLDQADDRDAFHWYVIDNGQTLSPAIEDDQIRLFPNKNTGGAGGFTRGMIEALRAEEGFTHVLLMDDDVEFFTESFARTYSLMRYVKPEHRQAFVSGSMFATSAPAVLFETLAVHDDLWAHSVHSNLDVRQIHQVMVNDHIPDGIFRSPHPSVYSGWWYCCIPTANIRARGLPLPLFIRCDDMEYSWRHHGVHHITLNGVCVWHQAFNEGRSLAAVGWSERYFAPRNMFVRNALHIPGVEAKFPRYFWAWFKDCLVQYNYQWAELLLAAMEDVLRGPACLKEDPGKILERLRHVFQPPSYQVGEQERADFRHAHPRMGWKRRLLYKLTLGGLLLPPALFPRAEGKCLGPFCPPGQFALRRRVHVLDESTGQCSVLEFDRRKSLKLGLRFLALLWKMKRNYRRLCQEYRQAATELTGAAFWQQYLDLQAAPHDESERCVEAAV